MKHDDSVRMGRIVKRTISAVLAPNTTSETPAATLLMGREWGMPKGSPI
jgi:hypothetical protein